LPEFFSRMNLARKRLDLRVFKCIVLGTKI